MIQVETVTINGRDFTHTYSDTGHRIERDGIQYDDAIDPVNSGRIYTETDTLIDSEEISDSEALKLITEGVV